ncbi:uncharacterized protein NPIL_485381 [Nephila pilipes]|uniref:Uncharacterized protein n=1 Tax=Nephila pilipes TaxID=299642 RepID=A0A8X6PLM2_NEPPI|nr:uncharacterized protein NPIL_485381 [Nephila pilipes]
MENIRKRVDIRLCSNGGKAERLISKPNFKDRTIFCENLAAFHMSRTSLTLNKPIAVEMSILDISKTLMCEFHYHKMKACYGENVKLLYTYSFIYDIKCDDIYSDIKNVINLFDTSEYPTDNIYGIPRKNKKVLGKMKDENCGKVMTEFIGLRSKMYSFKVEDCHLIKKKKTERCEEINFGEKNRF